VEVALLANEVTAAGDVLYKPEMLRGGGSARLTSLAVGILEKAWLKLVEYSAIGKLV
jgi:hypothetical protein